jgi:hypothetical protein
LIWLQDGRLHLQEAARVQFLPQRADDGALDLRHPPCPRIHDQIYITLADPRLNVRKSLVFLGKGPKALGRDGEPVRQHGEFSPAGGDDLAFHADVVPEVDVVLPGGQGVRADPVLRDHDLDVPGAVADGREAELPADARQQYPAGHTDLLAGRGVRLQVRVALADLADRGRAGKADRIGIGAGRQQPFPLGQPDPHLLRHVGQVALVPVGVTARRLIVSHPEEATGPGTHRSPE